MKIAACLIVKDEARDIAEWIAYHAVAGIDTFLVYDNGSADGTTAALQASAALFDVRVTPWPATSPAAQMNAYRHALRANRREFDWIAVIDSDEFIVVHPPGTLHDLCANKAAAMIGINWAMFGSNGHEQVSIRLVIEAFTRRAEAGFAANRHVKCILRPDALDECLNPHAFAVHGPVTRPDGQLLRWGHDDNGALHPGVTDTEPDYAVAQINHYFTRSRAHWLLKTARGYPNPQSMLKLNQFEDYDRNEVEDTSALWAVAEVRKRRAQILALALSQPSGPAATLQAWRSLRRADAMALAYAGLACIGQTAAGIAGTTNPYESTKRLGKVGTGSASSFSDSPTAISIARVIASNGSAFCDWPNGSSSSSPNASRPKKA